MTPSILKWLEEHVVQHTKPGHVLEVGAYDVNGNPRYIFETTAESYIGIDQFIQHFG